MMAPAAGLIGLVPMGGDGGRLIRLGQFLNGDGFADFEHAFVTMPGGQVIEAEPGGAVIRPLHYAAGSVHWCDGMYRLLRDARPRMRDADMAAEVAQAARGLEGVPYSWADYAALAAHRLRIPAPGLREYVASTGHLICSQLADVIYQRLGAQVFDDGRWNGYVTPGMLYKRDLELRKTLRPGVVTQERLNLAASLPVLQRAPPLTVDQVGKFAHPARSLAVIHGRPVYARAVRSRS